MFLNNIEANLNGSFRWNFRKIPSSNILIFNLFNTHLDIALIKNEKDVFFLSQI